MKYSLNAKVILRIPVQPLKTHFTKEDLLTFFTKKESQEALFLSSTDLLDAFKKWQSGILDTQKEDRLITALLKYATRMHSRCTPFGLFAGCGILDINAETIEVKKGIIERSTRLDMNFSCALAQNLAQLPYIQKHLKFYPNSSLYFVQDKLRYIEYYYKDKSRVHKISAVDSSIYLQKILQKARSGVRLNDLAIVIVDDDITFEEAYAFVTEIVLSQLLISELEPNVTGENLLNQIIKVFIGIINENEPRDWKKDTESTHEIQKIQGIIELLKSTNEQLRIIDNSNCNDISVYKQLAQKLSSLEVPFELNKLFQTDMFIAPYKSYKPKATRHNSEIVQNILQENDRFKQESEQSNALIIDSETKSIEVERKNKNLEIQLTKALTILNQLTTKESKTNLSEFKEKFYERYEAEEVPLLKVLDTEMGIGYAQNTNHSGDLNPLVNDLFLPFQNNREKKIIWNKRQSFLFKKLLEAQRNTAHSIELNSKDLKDFECDWNDLPDSFSVMYKHLGKRDNKDLISVENAGGSSATYLLGRFGSANKQIGDLVNEIAKAEQEKNPDSVLAEIVHLPESRTGNILMRPTFRDYEIPYLSNSTLPQEQQINLEDLFISIKYNRIYLWSKKLKKEVVPRMGNAHNFSFNSLPVYHFLCDLQTQNIRGGIYFDWGNLKDQFSFLPRVEVDNVVLSYASWQLKKVDYEVLLKKDTNLMEIAFEWRKKLRLPQLVLLADGDNELLINLENELSIKMFVSMIKKRSGIVLKEFLFDEKTAIVKDEDGNVYVNEFIAILEKSKSANRQNDSVNKEARQVPKDDLSRIFTIGSEWLYYKLYCGVRTSDKVLTEVIKPLTQELVEEGLIDSWFFIRYADPELHLRIRFHFSDLKNIGLVIIKFQNSINEYLKTGLIWKVQTDTYKKEIERYGENTIKISERLFHFDSEFVIGVLDSVHGDEGEDIRWIIAIKAVDKLLSDFNYSTARKKALMENLKVGFAHEFKMDKSLKTQLDKKFRKHRSTIESILSSKSANVNDLEPLFDLLEKKSRVMNSLVNQILSLSRKEQLAMPLDELIASYIHMLLNRLLKNKQRMHEMVIYDFMWRTYRSEIAKNKQLKTVL